VDCTQYRLTQLRKKRNKRKKGSILASLITRRSRLTHITLWRIEVVPFSDPSDAPTDLSSPFPLLYRNVGMVMMLKTGAPSHLLGGSTGRHRLHLITSADAA
jgi:hypothetical protein